MSERLVKEIAIKDDISSIKNKLEHMLINDFLTIEKIYQNNLFRKGIALNSGNSRVKRNSCIQRNLSFWKITTTNLINQP